MKPRLIFHCQHSLGIGHLVRSAALAAPLAADFDVAFLNGGLWPKGFPRPEGLRIIDLPPVRMDDEAGLVPVALDATLDDVMAARLAAISQVVQERPPAASVVELYPFGRKKLACEIDPLIEATRAADGVVICSVRDLLVRRDNQQKHDDRAAARLNSSFDLVIVHTDPNFARLDESFAPTIAVRTPIVYSGLVAPARDAVPAERARRIVVSAGGGVVGGPLYRAALDAAPAIRARTGLAMLIVAGPMYPETDWRALEKEAAAMGVETLRSTPNLFELMRRSAMSLSQCGYNTALDFIQSGVKALVVPFARPGESEQTDRARRLEALGLADIVNPEELSAAALADAVARLDARNRPAAATLDLDGAAKTARLVAEAVARGGAERRAS